ncbi:hypothetical protein FNF29_07014 [Cafeteria roenbergensis]|uniref:Uncharacterized protein n=2 Tax=Cafeteria roenbergensis TaxID=33653 RepID=A0A5A8C530_CAFRO|nr:hypothetical protein FNF29_07014 [Cafeteria roenbergensis]|eukprot:KAA0147925.1 hypothetical protein FNF29_07014 [Cafeteria roenbergensis]
MDRSAFVAAMVSELKTQSIRPGGLAARKPSWERACQDLATDMPEGRGDDLLALLAELGPRGSPSAWERVTPAVLSGLTGLCSRHLASQLPASPLAEAARALALGPTASADLAPEADSGSEDEDAGPKTAAGAMQTAGADNTCAAAVARAGLLSGLLERFPVMAARAAELAASESADAVAACGDAAEVAVFSVVQLGPEAPAESGALIRVLARAAGGSPLWLAARPRLLGALAVLAAREQALIAVELTVARDGNSCDEARADDAAVASEAAPAGPADDAAVASEAAPAGPADDAAVASEAAPAGPADDAAVASEAAPAGPADDAAVASEAAPAGPADDAAVASEAAPAGPADDAAVASEAAPAGPADDAAGPNRVDTALLQQGLTACSELVRLCEAAGGRWQAAVDELVFLAEDEEDEDEEEEGYPGGAGAGAHGRERAVAERVAVAAGGAGGIGVSMDLAGAGSGATLRRTAAGAAAASAAAAASSEDCDGGESGGAGLAAGDGDGDDAAAKAVQRARWLRSRAVAERRAAVEGAVAALEALGAGAGAAAAAVGGTGFMPRCLDRKRLAGLVRATLEAALDGRDIGGDAVDKGRGSSSTPAAVRAARVRRAERLELLQLASSRLAVALRRATAPLKAGPAARAPGNKAD